MFGNDWGGLDDEFQDVSDQVVESGGEDENVEYVGVVEEKSGGESMGRTPVQIPRGARVVQPVRMQQNSVQRLYNSSRRAAPAPTPKKEYREVQHREVPVGSVEVQIPTGSYLRFNEEAQQSMRNAPSVDVDGQMGRRVRPGMYVMMSNDTGGMGTNGDAAAAHEAIQSGTAVRTTATAATPTWLTAFTSVMDSAATAIGAGLGFANRRDQQNLANQLANAELVARTEADRVARGTASEEAARQHEETMQTLAQSAAELEALRQTAADTAAARQAAAANQGPLQNQAQGMSPVVWVSIAVVGVAGIGTLVYFLTRKK